MVITEMSQISSDEQVNDPELEPFISDFLIKQTVMDIQKKLDKEKEEEAEGEGEMDQAKPSESEKSPSKEKEPSVEPEVIPDTEKAEEIDLTKETEVEKLTPIDLTTYDPDAVRYDKKLQDYGQSAADPTSVDFPYGSSWQIREFSNGAMIFVDDFPMENSLFGEYFYIIFCIN